jgi:hypothetical protein
VLLIVALLIGNVKIKRSTMNWLLQGAWRKLAALCVLLFGIIIIIRDRQDNYNKLDQFQKRLLACTHHSDSLSSQLEGLIDFKYINSYFTVINHYKETVERLLASEKNTSARVSLAYETKIQYLSAKSDNLQVKNFNSWRIFVLDAIK